MFLFDERFHYIHIKEFQDKKEPLWGFLSCGNHSKYDLDIFCSGWSGWVRCTTVQSVRFVA